MAGLSTRYLLPQAFSTLMMSRLYLYSRCWSELLTEDSNRRRLLAGGAGKVLLLVSCLRLFRPGGRLVVAEVTR